jgi:hypothetical protein
VNSDLCLLEDSRQKDLKQAWGEWLTRLGNWDWWVTLTFRDPELEAQKLGWTKIGWGYSGRAWQKFTLEIGARKGLHDISWVRGREYQQWRGVPHFHGLVGRVPPGIRRMDMVDWWFRDYGIARIEPYNHELGAGYYLCKYVTKELGDIEFSKDLTTK